ncbi:TusE/DsrC/DsvC family sulfur relay protein [Candidatus Schneideria nysicola]|uniref:TusE/DsrC/DsvC family sulfur relay protein n=1 Tax=Candidatus Schneideria nysicola TaxID=1081631 RepID=UPI001CAA5369|nr:TusE/DsrC/DsvC family sulfur relay protein [Candidatus Schneideria nysicola]UAJ64799.1 TusE/DsrC/DsvC family sulfur relay protein [Candidatus Schneideria nysicola]
MTTLSTDSDGYLINLHDWNESIAIEFAKIENIHLTTEHWEIIYHLRDFYINFNFSPSNRILIKSIKKKYGEEKGNNRYLFKLFPKGIIKQAIKIAGLPKPIHCF